MDSKEKKTWIFSSVISLIIWIGVLVFTFSQLVAANGLSGILIVPMIFFALVYFIAAWMVACILWVIITKKGMGM